MSKVGDLAASFVRKTRMDPAPQVSRPPMNAFGSLFAIAELSSEEEAELSHFLQVPGVDSPETFDRDLQELSSITKEVKAIRKQEILLVGERLKKAKDLFRNYREKGFRDWMDFSLGSFKTGYNYLSFFELYAELPGALRAVFKQMPAKAAYILASKKMPLSEKVAIIQEHGKSRASEIIASVQQEGLKLLPIDPVEKVLQILEKQATTLKRCPLSISQREKLSHLVDLLENLL